MKVKVWVEDEFGEVFRVDVTVTELLSALERSPLESDYRVPNGDGLVFLRPGLWLCVRVGVE